MTEPHIRLLDDLEAEFARVAAEHERASRPPRIIEATPARALLVALGVLVLLLAGAYAVPPTRAAIDDVTSTFADWVGGDDGAAPGRALQPGDDAPDWVREDGGRLIVARHGVELYVSRSERDGDTYLNFSLDKGIGMGGPIDWWRKHFDNHAATVLGYTLFGPQDVLDERGRFPLFGVTARSVESVELRYEDQGAPVVESGLDGGFILLVDAWRPKRDLVAYDAAGHVLDRVGLADLDTRYLCEKEPTCPDPF